MKWTIKSLARGKKCKIMKKRSNILIVLAIVMATIIGAVVACSPDALTESSADPIGSKSVSPTKEEVALNQYLFEI